MAYYPDCEYEKYRDDVLYGGVIGGLKIDYPAGDNIKQGERVEIIDGKLYPVLSEKRKMQIVKDCLRYALHRIRGHKECGISGLCEWQTIERILEELD